MGDTPNGQDLSDFLAASSPSGLARLLTGVAEAAASLASTIHKGPLAGELHAPVGSNSDGDVQKAHDILADETFERAFRRAGVRAFVSEEREGMTPLDPDGAFLVALDPLDGSSNIETNITVGTIFGVLDAPTGAVDVADFLKPGHELRAAGVILYGPHVAMTFTTGAGAHVAVLDPDTRRFHMTRLNLHIPEGSAEFAINASNARHWTAPIRAYIDDLVMGETGPRVRDFNMRWIASMAADVYRVLQRGGVYLYPEDSRPGYAKGRLHLVYEGNPVALLIEQAGGLAIDGVNRILDIEPEGLHTRTPLIFGSTDKVERVRSYALDGHRSASRAPLFGRRGLWR